MFSHIVHDKTTKTSIGMLESDLENLEDEVVREGGEEDMAIPDHVTSQDIRRGLTTHFSYMNIIYKVNSTSLSLKHVLID